MFAHTANSRHKGLWLQERILLEAIKGGQATGNSGTTQRKSVGPEGPRIRASVLADFCMDAHSEACVIEVCNLIVVGDLDLRWKAVRPALNFNCCQFLGRVLISDAELPELTFHYCELREGFEGARAHVRGRLSFLATVLHGPLLLHNARISSDFVASGSLFRSRHPAAIDADAISIGGDAILGARDERGEPVTDEHDEPIRFRAEGAVNLNLAHIEGQFSCGGARLSNRDGDALNLYEADIRGGTFLREAIDGDGRTIKDKSDNVLQFTAEGKVNLGQAKLGGPVVMAGSVANPSHGALDMQGATIGGPVYLVAQYTGEADLSNCHAEESLDCSQASFANPGGDALDLSAAKIDGTLRLGGEFRGTVRFSTVTIGGLLSCDGGRFLNARGMAIVGEAITVADAVALRSATVEGEVDLIDADIGGIFDVSGTTFTHDEGDALDLSGARIRGAVNLSGKFSGTVRLSTAELERVLDCRGGRFSSRNKMALIAERVSVKSAALLDPIRSEGEVNLAGAEIGGPLNLSGASLSNPEGAALVLSSAKLRGEVRLNGGFEASGAVSLRDCVLDGRLDATASVIENPGGQALDLSGGRFRGDVFLTGKYLGAVKLSTADFSGILNCRDAAFTHPGHTSLMAERVTIKSAVLLDTVRSEGDVKFAGAEVGGPFIATDATFRAAVTAALDLSSAQIGGDLRLNGSTLSYPSGLALDLTGTRVTGGTHLGAEFAGLVTLSTAKLSGILTCRNGKFHNPSMVALMGQRATITGGLLLDPIEVEGEVDFVGAEIAGPVIAAGGKFSNEGGRALDLTSATIGSDVDLGSDFSGTVQLIAAEVGGDVICRGGRFTKSSKSDWAFDAERLHANGVLRWTDVTVDGNIDLRNAVISRLDDDESSWPHAISLPSWRRHNRDQKNGSIGIFLDGFEYAALSDLSPKDWKFRRNWLETQVSYASQPYRQLAGVYRNEGRDRSARKISMEQFNSQLRRPDSLRPSGRLSVVRYPMRLWRQFLRLSIGHGYEPWRILAIALVIWLLAWFGVASAVEDGAMVPARPIASQASSAQQGVSVAAPMDCDRRDYPCLEPAVYAADLLIPIVNLGQRDYWRPAGPLRYRAIPPVSALLGWAITTLAVAGFTSLVRRE